VGAGVPYVLIICVAAVICLVPLAVYLRFVAALGQRQRATVISGVLDFAGLVAGLSGFLIFGGVLLLALLQSRFRAGMQGGFAALRAGWEQQATTWSVLAGLYILAVVAWLSLVSLSRRRSWVIYNVVPAAVEECISQVFSQLGVVAQRRGNVWYREQEALCEIEGFGRGHTVTLWWLHPDRTLYEEMDRILRNRASKLDIPAENGASLWLRVASSGLGVFAMTCLGLLTYALFWT